jgi:hypothetical protein
MRERFELVICYTCCSSCRRRRAGIANLARVCRGALYFGALTLEDWRDNCDQGRTDRIPGLRSDRWYRRELNKEFRFFGGGLWLRRGAPLTLWSLDAA